MTTDPPTLYTTAQAAELLGISRQLVHKYTKRHNIGAIIGGHRLLTAADIETIRTRPDHRQIGLTNRWPAPGHDERP
jgi:excisionase family DNA binding protein